MSGARSAALARALELSRQVLSAAEQSDAEGLPRLDAERMRLLQSARAERGSLSAADHRMLSEVAELNDRAIGAMEHHRRIKERAIDMAAVGRRAVAAYAMTGPRR
ncbi:MAG TPA: hypothetical protein VHV81_12765 [Steroidobacteraceae bacterium]|jgi:hypothetical protein|nr:hypothetical protein [Steroidobacteraceae bacterium]